MYKILKDISEIQHFIPTDVVFCDLETIGLFGEIRLFQFCQYHWEEACIIEYPDVRDLIEFISHHKTVWYNAHYDLTTLSEQANKPVIPLHFDDLFFAAKIFYPDEPKYSLDKVLFNLHGEDLYKKHLPSVTKKDLQGMSWGGFFLSDDQLKYSALDVLLLKDLYKKLSQVLHDSVYMLDIASLRCALQFQRNGMPVNQEEVKKEKIKTTKELKELDIPINYNSWQQVRDWLKINESNKIFLKRLAILGNKKAELVLKGRQLSKRINFLEKYDTTRVFGKFSPTTRAGRFSCHSENLQQIPRELKKVFGFPESSDRTLIYSDFSQLELRTMCALIGEKKMEEMFREDIDIHSYVANSLYGKNYSQIDRFSAKCFNFILLYSGSVYTIQNQLILNGLYVQKDQLEHYIDKWLQIFPDIRRWHRTVKFLFQNNKTLKTPMGRTYMGRTLNEHINIQNQGAGAEISKKVLQEFQDYLNNYWGYTQVKICNFVHDSYTVDAPNIPKTYKAVADNLAHIMLQVWINYSKKLFKIKDLPMPVDVFVGNNWGKIEESPKYQINLNGKYEI